MKEYNAQKESIKKLNGNILTFQGLKKMNDKKIELISLVSLLGITCAQTLMDFEDDITMVIIKAIPASILYYEVLIDTFDTIREIKSEKKLDLLCNELNKNGIQIKKDDFKKTCVKGKTDQEDILNLMLSYKRSIVLDGNVIKFIDKDGKQKDITDSVNKVFLSKRTYKKIRNRQNS